MTVRHLAIIAVLGTPPVVEAQACPRDTLSRQELGQAMRDARLAPGGDYSLLATTNSVRFQSAVLERLIRRALGHRPSGGVIFIPYDALWWEYLAVAGLGPGQEDKAPIGRHLAFDFHQSIEVTYGPLDGIISRIKQGPAPLIAANVSLDWPDRSDGLRKFSFVDTMAVPQMKVTNHQVMTFRFLVFSDMTVLDDIEGISGRPLSGLLGAIFKVIGEGDAAYARFSLSADGRQVLRTKVTKLVSKTVTATINPDGKGQNGLPDDRPDLVTLESRLKQPLEFAYHPYRCHP